MDPESQPTPENEVNLQQETSQPDLKKGFLEEGRQRLMPLLGFKEEARKSQTELALQNLHFLKDEYGLEVDIGHISKREKLILGESQRLENLRQACTALENLKQEVCKLPPELVKAYLKKVRIVKGDLYMLGRPESGGYALGPNAYVSYYPSHSPLDFSFKGNHSLVNQRFRVTAQHEIYHVITRFATHIPSWSSLLDKSQEGDFANIYFLDIYDRYNKKHPEHQTDKVVEDEAETAAALMTQDKGFLSRVNKSPILREKRDLIMQSYKELSGGLMDENYFKDLAEGKVNEGYWKERASRETTQTKETQITTENQTQ